jgi:hypothetical protein
MQLHLKSKKRYREFWQCLTNGYVAHYTTGAILAHNKFSFQATGWDQILSNLSTIFLQNPACDARPANHLIFFIPFPWQ